MSDSNRYWKRQSAHAFIGRHYEKYLWPFYYESLSKMDDILNLKNSKYQNWKTRKSSRGEGKRLGGMRFSLPEKAYFQFCGVGLTLHPDGTYDLEDTTVG